MRADAEAYRGVKDLVKLAKLTKEPMVISTKEKGKPRVDQTVSYGEAPGSSLASAKEYAERAINEVRATAHRRALPREQAAWHSHRVTARARACWSTDGRARARSLTGGAFASCARTFVYAAARCEPRPRRRCGLPAAAKVMSLE